MKTLRPLRRTAGGIVVACAIAGCTRAGTQSSAPVSGTVGPERGTAVVVGGGQMGPDIRQRFIQLAGGPDALIIDIPTAGGAPAYDQNGGGARGWRARHAATEAAERRACSAIISAGSVAPGARSCLASSSGHCGSSRTR